MQVRNQFALKGSSVWHLHQDRQTDPLWGLRKAFGLHCSDVLGGYWIFFLPLAMDQLIPTV